MTGRSHRGGGPPSNAGSALNAGKVHVQVYRFEDAIALSVEGTVVYLSRRQAQSLGRALHACGVDVTKNADAAESKFKGFNLS